jgi:hypothetical protein
MSEWLDSMKRRSFPLAQKLHAMYLHFKTEGYSYPQYGSKTRLSLASFGSRQKKDILVFNTLTTSLESSQVDVEKYLFVNALVDNLNVRTLFSPNAVKNHSHWASALNSKKVFDAKIEALLHNDPVSTGLCWRLNDWTPAGISRAHDCFLGHLTIYSAGCGDLVRLDSLFQAVYILNKFPQFKNQELILDQLMIEKLMKAKAFTDWWCLTN